MCYGNTLLGFNRYYSSWPCYPTATTAPHHHTTCAAKGLLWAFAGAAPEFFGRSTAGYVSPGVPLFSSATCSSLTSWIMVADSFTLLSEVVFMV